MEPNFALDRCTLRLVDLLLLLLALVQFVPIIVPEQLLPTLLLHLLVLNCLPVQRLAQLLVIVVRRHRDPDFSFAQQSPLIAELVEIIENLKPLGGFHQPELPQLVELR